MKKILYTKPDGSICIVIPAPKQDIERLLGPLTEEEYESHVRERSIPADALNIRDVKDTDIPESREFRNAWVDITKAKKIDICCTKAKDIALNELRLKRNNKLKETDAIFMQALEANDTVKLDEIKKIRKDLRDLTEPLKAINTEKKLNDKVILQQLRDLSKAAD